MKIKKRRKIYERKRKTSSSKRRMKKRPEEKRKRRVSKKREERSDSEEDNAEESDSNEEEERMNIKKKRKIYERKTKTSSSRKKINKRSEEKKKRRVSKKREESSDSEEDKAEKSSSTEEEERTKMKKKKEYERKTTTSSSKKRMKKRPEVKRKERSSEMREESSGREESRSTEKEEEPSTPIVTSSIGSQLPRKRCSGEVNERAADDTEKNSGSKESSSTENEESTRKNTQKTAHILERMISELSNSEEEEKRRKKVSHEEVRDSGEEEDDEEMTEEESVNSGKEEDDEQDESYCNTGAIDWSAQLSKDKTKLIKLLRMFYQHLLTPEGNRMKDQQANQVVQQVYSLVQKVSTNMDLEKVLTGNAIWDVFVDPALKDFMANLENEHFKGMKPSTLSVYLLSMEKFIDFMMLKRGEQSIYKALKARLPKWQTSLKREKGLQFHARFQKDKTNLPDPQQIKELLECEVSKVIVRKILSTDDDDETYVTVADAVNARDYLITRFTLENVSRPGVLEAITLHTINQMRYLKKEKLWSGTVFVHKTLTLP